MQARLRLNTDTDEERDVLQLQAYQAALRSRGDYKTTADSIAKLGLLAGDAFNSNTETVLFAELMNKSFKLSGASTEEKMQACISLHRLWLLVNYRAMNLGVL